MQKRLSWKLAGRIKYYGKRDVQAKPVKLRVKSKLRNAGTKR
jgi:hypothetical protein